MHYSLMGKIGLPFIDSDLLYRGSTVLVFIKQDKNDMKFPPPTNISVTVLI